MNGLRRTILVLGVLGLASGCQGGPSRRTVAVEPGLADPVDPGTTIVEAQPARELTFVERHPLLYKPRQYYDRNGTNKVAKVAAATVLGVPAGIVGELRQIVVGQTPAAGTQ
jgi:hypothetical protein